MSNHSPLSDVRTTALAAPTLDIVTPQAIRTLFWRPRFLADEPALDHLPLLFWLTEAVAPACIVDLGCRQGTAHLAFCQAVDKLGLEARCLALGAWPQGLPEMLRRQSAEFYEDISHLLRGPASAALSLAGGVQVDILHADLEALAEDQAADPEALVAAWAPRMTDRGVIVLQGTASLGTAGLDALRRLAGRHASASFDHGRGLMLLLVGTAPADRVARLAALQTGMPGHSTVQQIFRRLGRALRLECAVGGSAAAETVAVHAPVQAAMQAAVWASPSAAAADPAELEALRQALEAERAATRSLREDQARALSGLTMAQAQAQDEIARLQAEAADLRRAAQSASEASNPSEEADRLRAEIARLQAEVDQQRARADAFEQHSHALQASTSWKVTAPMRRLVMMARRGG